MNKTETQEEKAMKYLTKLPPTPKQLHLALKERQSKQIAELFARKINVITKQIHKVLGELKEDISMFILGLIK